MNSDQKPSIIPNQDGPYIVKGLKNFANQKGSVDAKETMALCRCGASDNKPFCDGAHAKIGFKSAKLEGRTPDQIDNYNGQKITIHDNRRICAHAGRCTDGLSSVFCLREEPFVNPDGGSVEDIISTIKQCPSGALSYSIDGVEHRDWDGEPSVFIAPNGPYVVSGGPELIDSPQSDGASKKQFTMCRCGGSKNKPFCDGAHWSIEFKDDKN